MAIGQFFCRECGGFTVLGERDGEIISDTCTCHICQECGKECGH